MADSDVYKPLKPATVHTCQAQVANTQRLDFSDDACFDDARRGFIDTLPHARITNRAGRAIWDLSAYAFLESEQAPDSVNPSLWRQARLNQIHGLFEVCEGFYQVRGFDIANVTFIEGQHGVIVIDPLTVCEASEAALALYRKHRGQRPVTAVIYSHSHVDHYGGVEGVMTPEQAQSGEVKVIAPVGFMEEAVSENILAGVPMRRRALFQFGSLLPKGVRAHVDSGLGIATGSGTVSLIEPTQLITQAMETHVIDGVEIVFQLTPGSEAPAEMNFFFPQFKVLNLAENGCHTMHNLCPLRGAKTRDALAWSKYLNIALHAFIDQTDVVVAQHHWPTWGRERVRQFITEQRDLYRVMHDQTLRMMSLGQTPHEIAQDFRMPEGLATRWHARPYYGAIEHNLRAVYAHYMGPYDGNPFNLNPLPPRETALKTIAYMGGRDAVMARAQADFDAGDYRWVVQVSMHLVFADPNDQAAKALAADAMEQLGYQAESATWRNSYLQGAQELREGPPKPVRGGINRKVVAMLPMEMFFDYLAIRVNAQRAQGLLLRIDWTLQDEDTRHQLTLSNSALSHAPGSHGEQAMVSVHMSRDELRQVVASGEPLMSALQQGLIRHDGDTGVLAALFETFDEFPFNFNILEP